MHISIISSSAENIIPPSLDNTKGLTILKSRSVQSALDENIALGNVFFDAALGEKSITQQINLCPSQWLVINMNKNIQKTLQYLQLGASGVLIRPFNSTKLRYSTQSLADKKLYIDDELKQILAFRQIKKILQPFNDLSSREFDVFCLLAEGFSIQSIAKLLTISVKTAFNCQTQLRQKLRLKNQQQIVQYAKTHRLIF